MVTLQLGLTETNKTDAHILVSAVTETISTLPRSAKVSFVALVDRVKLWPQLSFLQPVLFQQLWN